MNLEKATVCCELTTQKLPCLHSILRTVGWSGTRHRWRNEMCNEPSPNLCFLCYSPAVPDSRLVTVLPPLARARPARVYGIYMIMSIMNSVFMRKTQAPETSLNSAAVPLPNAVLARKIPLSERSPNRIQTIDIHNISTLRAVSSGAQTGFFPCRQRAGGCYVSL